MSDIILRLQFLFPLPLQGHFDLSAFEYLNHSFMQQYIKLRCSYRVTPADVDKGITFSLKKIPHFFLLALMICLNLTRDFFFNMLLYILLALSMPFIVIMV